jgi:hypothetical protein
LRGKQNSPHKNLRKFVSIDITKRKTFGTMPVHRSFNPYSAAPPPPSSLPDYKIIASTITPLTDEQAGHLIDTFLQTQDGKVLTLHRLADHLLGRKPTANDTELQELEIVLEEERRREGGIVQVQQDLYDDEGMEEKGAEKGVVKDKKKARKDERKMKKEMKKEKEGEKRKMEESLKQEGDGKKAKKSKKDKSVGNRGKRIISRRICIFIDSNVRLTSKHCSDF